MNDTVKLDTPIKRALFNSSLHNTWVRLGMGLGIIALIIWAFPVFLRYYLEAPLQMATGIALAALLYSPTLFVLAFMMRRKRISRVLFWTIPLSVILFFGPLTSQTNHSFQALGVPDYLFVGFSEESWKIMPLLLILIFARPLITGVRDGIFYGALGGFGFACLEMGSYFALVDYPETGWTDFFLNSMSRATLLGTDLHIVWSAFLGGAIVYGLNSSRKWSRFIIPFSGYVLVVLTHGIQDKFGKLLSMLPIAVVVKIAESFGATEENFTPLLIPVTMFGATTDILLINLIVLPLLIWMTLRGGDSDRAAIREYLQDETTPFLLPNEKPGLETQSRFHRRRIGSDSSIDKTIVRAQNELSFRKKQLEKAGSPDSDDLIVASLRNEISQLRTSR